jgi:hypothetical protein
MLGGMRGHADERALLHAAFLAAPPPLAARMLLPALFLLDAAAGRFQALAPADTALLPGARGARAAAGAARAGEQRAERRGLSVVGSRRRLALRRQSDEAKWRCMAGSAATSRRRSRSGRWGERDARRLCLPRIRRRSLVPAASSQGPLPRQARQRRRSMACYACLMKAACC